MFKKDISIFDTKSNTIEKVASNTLDLSSDNNQAAMTRDGQVIALVLEKIIGGCKAIKFTKG